MRGDNGFQFQDASEAVAPDFPEVNFAVIAGLVSNDENLASVTHQEWQAGYLAGVVAGSITEEGTIAYMGGVPIPPIAQFGNAYKLGAESVNPDVKVLLTYTGSFDDVAKGKQTALSLVNQGADVICANANVEGPAAIETAQEEGILAIGALFDSTGVAQPGTDVPFQFFLAIPYVITIVVLITRIGSAAAPREVGQAWSLKILLGSSVTEMRRHVVPSVPTSSPYR